MEKTYQSTATVTEQNCALAIGSGDLNVYATPSVIALMENAAMKLASQIIEPENTTVGTHISASHTRASGIGEHITATATLVEQNGRELKFKVVATDSKGEIAGGEHTRFVVNREKFISKL